MSRRRHGASRHTQSSSTALKPKSSVNNGIASPVVGGGVGGEPDVGSGARAHASSLSMVVSSGSSAAATGSSRQRFSNDGLITSTFWSVLGSLFSFGDGNGNERDAMNRSGDGGGDDLSAFSTTTTTWRKDDSDAEDGDEDDSITSSEEGQGTPQTVLSAANNNVIPPSIKKRSPGSAPKKCSGTRQSHHHRDNSMPSSKNDPNSVTSTIAGATTEKVQNKDVALR